MNIEDRIVPDIARQVRYHHDGKYNVMSLAGPIEIYGENTADRR